jgi:hypothetical protein
MACMGMGDCAMRMSGNVAAPCARKIALHDPTLRQNAVADTL